MAGCQPKTILYCQSFAREGVWDWVTTSLSCTLSYTAPLNLSSPIPLNTAEIIIIPSSPNPLNPAEGRSISISRPFELFRYDRGRKSLSVKREITPAYFGFNVQTINCLYLINIVKIYGLCFISTSFPH